MVTVLQESAVLPGQPRSRGGREATRATSLVPAERTPTGYGVENVNHSIPDLVARNRLARILDPAPSS